MGRSLLLAIFLKTVEVGSDTSELTQADFDTARQFALDLLRRVGPLIDEMQLTRNQAELAFAYLLAESLSHRDKELRQILAAQWGAVLTDAAEDFEAFRRRTII